MNKQSLVGTESGLLIAAGTWGLLSLPAMLTLSNCRGGARKAVKGSGTHSRRAEKYWHNHAELNKPTDKALGVLLKNLAKCSSLDKNVERLVMHNFILCWILKWLMPSCLSKLIGHCCFL